jgi:phosphatidylglycerol:prolipoprotein diacylglycerol transferase
VIELPFDPDVVIGPLRFSWHSFFSFVGMVIGGTFSVRIARYLVRDERIYPFAFLVIAGGIVGARIAHVIDNWPTYAGDPLRIVDLSKGGIGTMGAPIGSSIAGYFACRWLRLPMGFMFDISVIGIALGEAIGRIGDVINGEHHGTPCSGLPWCVRYTSPSTLGQATPVHPIGIYDGLLMLAIFVVIFWYWRRVRGQPPESRVYWAYLLGLGAGRFLESFVREDPVVLFGLQEAHILGLIYAIAGAAMLWVLSMRTTRRQRA